ncbi:sulfotransferase family 2 domain-containing protein [Paenibacillus gorillae]|uniref:sulfotransferase family 2 domain-containing protein n=1 Tax=Paenibacillus gorillae TaxID=1243662 RepID=UPI001EE2601F|nr:sulfotransferase family 2 domain-containing protein [Paenibacillus gorillae]
MKNKADDSLFLFMHIPKTGGTSLTQLLLHRFPKLVYYFEVADDQTLLLEKLQEADAFCGHYPFGLHSFTSRPYRYMTMLRDPVEQIISYFYFKYKNPKYPASYNIGITLDYFVNDDSFDLEYVNLQTRFVSGELCTTQPDLELAKANLRNYFDFIGITERYADSQFLLSRQMGWKLKSYPRLNETPNRVRQSECAAETIERIKAKNAADMKLYRYALELLDQKTSRAFSCANEGAPQIQQSLAICCKKAPSDLIVRFLMGLSLV